MSHRPALPPHLADLEELKNEELSQDIIRSRGSKIGPQGPSKYGAGGRRIAKAKGRGKTK